MMHNDTGYRSCTIITCDTTSYTSHPTDHITTSTCESISKPCSQAVSDDIDFIFIDTVLLTKLVDDLIKQRKISEIVRFVATILSIASRSSFG